MGGKLVESISRRVSTSMPNGTNWDDVQILQRLQRRGEYNNKTIILFTKEESKGHLEKIAHERYESSPDQISKTVEKAVELTVEEKTLERNS